MCVEDYNNHTILNDDYHLREGKKFNKIVYDNEAITTNINKIYILL
jgi:hypothetical protein